MNKFFEQLKAYVRSTRPKVGGYRYIKVRDVLLDPRQKASKGTVTLYYAELVERNKYAPGWAKRGLKR